MDSYAERRMVQAVLSRLGSLDQQAAVVQNLAASLLQDPDRSRLPEARLVAEFLNFADAGRYDAIAISNVTSALSEFIFLNIGNSPDPIALAPLIALTGTNRAVSDRVYRTVLHVFLAHAAASLPSEEVQPFVALRRLVDDLAASPSNKPSILGPEQCISFFTAYFRSSTTGRMQIGSHSACLAPALAFLAGEDKALGRAATHMAVTLVDCLPDVEPSSDDPHFDVVWLTVTSLVNQRLFPNLITPALTLWLRLAARLVPFRLLAKREYWDALHSVLSHGTPEQQKVSLAIFRVSISVFYKKETESASITAEEAEEKLAKYDRFMTLYQAVVLDRYINQVHETLTDLTTMAGLGDAGIEPRWLFALLFTALSPNTQNSVRKFIGDWVLSNSQLFTHPSYTDGPALLEHGFLHWAMNGTLFESALRVSDDGKPYSQHGNRLSAFVGSALASADGHGVAHAHLKAILRFITAQGHRSYPPARALVIEGIDSGLQDSGLVFDQDEQEMIYIIAMKSGFIDIASDYTALLGYRIMQRSRASSRENAIPIPEDLSAKSASILSADPKNQVNAATARGIMAAAASIVLDEPDVNTDILSWLYQSIKSTKHACLFTSGLSVAVQLLSAYVKKESPSNMDPTHLRDVLSAIWEEIEVQDYPRAQIMSFTSMALHPATIEVFANDDTSLSAVSEYLETLSGMSKRKVYVFSALARSWRYLVQARPVEASKLPLFSFLKSLALNPPVLKSEFMTEDALAARLVQLAPARTYETYYGKTESYAYACVFDMMNTLPRSDSYIHQAKALFQELFSQWAEQEPTEAVFSDWKSTTQLQVLLVLLEYSLPHMGDDEIDKTFRDLIHVLDIELLPRYRFLVEWMAMRVLAKSPVHRPYILTRQGEMDITNPKAAISILKLSIMTSSFADTPEPHARELATQLVLLTGSQKIAIRHEAQWAFPQLWRLAQARAWTSITSDAVVQRIDAHIRSLDAFKNPPPARAHERLDDPAALHCLAALVDGYYLDIEPVERARARRTDFLAVWADDGAASARERARAAMMPLGEARPHAPRTAHAWHAPAPGSSTGSAALQPLQTKGKFALDTPARIPLSLLDAPGPTQPARARPTPLILAASLIDIPYNLGGLCRAAEILGAAAMVHSSAAAVGSAAFASVAVSAHLHLPLVMQPRAQLREYLRARQAEGYEVVGVEQTDASAVLGGRAARFRRDGRTVLLLGREREGIPGELLGVCDWCVEVRQLGVTRSMNVQTAAAVVMHEYVRQFQGGGGVE